MIRWLYRVFLNVTKSEKDSSKKKKPLVPNYKKGLSKEMIVLKKYSNASLPFFDFDL